MALRAAILAWISRLRFPTLLGIVAVLFLADLWIPDPIPFLDEAVLLLGTAALAAWRKDKGGPTDLEASSEN